MNELHDVLSPGRHELVDDLNELRRAETELRLFAAALRPAPAPFGGQLDAHAALRHDPHLVRHLQQHVEFADLLDDDENLVSQALPHQREPHEFLVLVPVADDEVVSALGQCQHGLQFRLRSAFKPDTRRLSELDDFFDHVALLIDLDGIDRGVVSLILEFLDRRLETRVQCLDARTQDVGKTEQHGQENALRLEIACEFVQVEGPVRMVLVRAHHDVPFVVHIEVAITPSFDVVQRSSGGDAPALRRRAIGRGRRERCGSFRGGPGDDRGCSDGRAARHAWRRSGRVV